MNPFTSYRTTSILTLMLVFVLLFLIIDGCNKDDSSTGPYSPPTYPSVVGHWVGNGSYFSSDDGMRFNIAWIVDFAARTENTFAGNRTGTYTTGGGYLGAKTIWGSRGTVTMSRQVTITDTSGVFVSAAGQTIPIIASLMGTWGPCILSANGDTLSYSGPSPENEVFVLVRQH